MVLEPAILHLLFVNVQLSMPGGEGIALAEQRTVGNKNSWMWKTFQPQRRGRGPLRYRKGRNNSAIV